MQLDHEMYKRIVCSIIVSRSDDPVLASYFITPEFVEKLFSLYKQNTITDIQIFVPILMNFSIPAQLMEKILVRIMLNHEVKIHG